MVANCNLMIIGLIILPIVGNAAEHLTAVTCAMKNKVRHIWIVIARR